MFETIVSPQKYEYSLWSVHTLAHSRIFAAIRLVNASSLFWRNPFRSWQSGTHSFVCMNVWWVRVMQQAACFSVGPQQHARRGALRVVWSVREPFCVLTSHVQRVAFTGQELKEVWCSCGHESAWRGCDERGADPWPWRALEVGGHIVYVQMGTPFRVKESTIHHCSGQRVNWEYPRKAGMGPTAYKPC